MFTKFLNSVFPLKIAYAHCDIPCGIYDPHNAQMAAHTVLRMTSLLEEMKLDAGEEEAELKKSHQHLTRLVSVKESHAEIVEKEVVTLWGDYFKDEHFKTYPNITELTQQILKLTSKTRQEISLEKANELVDKVLDLAEIFYKTKNFEPVRVKSPYLTEKEIVTYK